MRIIFTLAAATLLAAPAIAERDFEYDGKRYIYTSVERGGATVITGRSLPDGGRYRLVVRNGRVTGFRNGWPVKFKLDRTRSQAERLAAR